MSEILTQEQANEMMQDMGVSRYLNQLKRAQEEGRESTTGAGRQLFDWAVGELHSVLERYIAKLRRQRFKSEVQKILIGLDLKIAACVTAQQIIDRISWEGSFLSVSYGIGRALEDEARFSEMRRVMPEEWQKATFRAKTLHEHHRRKVLIAAANRVNFEWEGWTLTDKYKVGGHLLTLFIAATGLVEEHKKLESNRGKIRTKTSIQPTDRCLEWLSDTNSKYSGACPFYLPMVVPPESWVSLYSGGYPLNEVRRSPLILRGAEENDFDSSPEALPEVYRAANALQAVPWEVSKDVFRVFRDCWRLGVEIGELPPAESHPLPPKPTDIDTNEDSKKAWKREASVIHEANARLKSKRVQVSRIFGIAEKYQHQPFWFPTKIDFRGRMYPVPNFLTPQGTDLAKGLLRFAEGKPLRDREAVRWWMIHGANSWGMDKIPYSERVAWVQQNSAMIRACAQDPMANRQWGGADKPWAFLAWAFEFEAFSQDPKNFLNHVPISMDGSNNGLQLFSLLLRDPVGALATNVAPSPDGQVQDVYQQVGDRVWERLQADQDSKLEAKNWVKFLGDSVPRALTKRCVMIVPYGGTQHACRRYIGDWFTDELRARKQLQTMPFENPWVHTSYLTTLVLQSINEVVVGARAGMDWLREVAQITAKLEIPIQWRTASGFRCRQATKRQEKVLLRMKIGKVFKIRSLKRDVAGLSVRDQANGLPPNFIHSLDAALMTLTINACREQGIDNFAMVHDSYGTHAADASAMARILREQAVSMFSSDLLEEFEAGVRATLPEGVELPPRPAMGDLDVSSVVDSLYFFH